MLKTFMCGTLNKKINDGCDITLRLTKTKNSYGTLLYTSHKNARPLSKGGPKEETSDKCSSSFDEHSEQKNNKLE